MSEKVVLLDDISTVEIDGENVRPQSQLVL